MNVTDKWSYFLKKSVIRNNVGKQPSPLNEGIDNEGPERATACFVCPEMETVIH
jgi:hypothetical protein